MYGMIAKKDLIVVEYEDNQVKGYRKYIYNEKTGELTQENKQREVVSSKKENIINLLDKISIKENKKNKNTEMIVIEKYTTGNPSSYINSVHHYIFYDKKNKKFINPSTNRGFFNLCGFIAMNSALYSNSPEKNPLKSNRGKLKLEDLKKFRKDILNQYFMEIKKFVSGSYIQDMMDLDIIDFWSNMEIKDEILMDYPWRTP
jgi:hypothetical protein